MKFRNRIIVIVSLAVAVCGAVKTARPQLISKESAVPPLPMMMQAGGTAGCRMAIRATKQGQLKGDGTVRGQEKWFRCSQFLFSLTSPRDAATGLPSGKRQYVPIVITKDWDAASPQIFQAAATNEVLPLVELEFWRASPQGAETVLERVTLTNATISSVKQYIGFPSAGEPPNSHPQEDVALTFQKIEMTNPDGKTGASDDWSAVR